MSFGTARRGMAHAMGTGNPTYVPVWRVTSALVVAKGQDGRLQHCYHGDTLDWLSDDEAGRFQRFKLVERIDADAQNADDLDTEDTDAGSADSDAVDECIATLARLQMPTTAGAPACRTALRGNGHRFGNAVVAAAVKHRKLSGTAEDLDDDEDFEAVVVL